MVIAIDSNIVDLVGLACGSPEHIDAIDACAPPPPHHGIPWHLQVEVIACHWILAHAPFWRSTVYTLSNRLHGEIGAARRAPELMRVMSDVLVREEQPPDCRIPDAARRPSGRKVKLLGIKAADADHVVDAIGLSCDRLLTNDRRLRRFSNRVEGRWGLGIRRPSEFLAEAVRAGAPWKKWAPWPWEAP